MIHWITFRIMKEHEKIALEKENEILRNRLKNRNKALNRERVNLEHKVKEIIKQMDMQTIKEIKNE